MCGHHCPQKDRNGPGGTLMCYVLFQLFPPSVVRSSISAPCVSSVLHVSLYLLSFFFFSVLSLRFPVLPALSLTFQCWSDLFMLNSCFFVAM